VLFKLVNATYVSFFFQFITDARKKLYFRQHFLMVGATCYPTTSEVWRRGETPRKPVA